MNPEILETARLLLRRPTPDDAFAVFDRYAGDPVVTRYLSWPTHRTLADTHAFLAWSDAEWAKAPAGPYLVFSRGAHCLLGATGLSFTSPTCAVTGYVLARDAWGRGYATESLQAMVDLAYELGLGRLEAICHIDHRASVRVLEKCGFQLEEILRQNTEFPNLSPGEKSDVLSFARRF
jgi:RimJ/RimL family protein N-acetyltransferase